MSKESKTHTPLYWKPCPFNPGVESGNCNIPEECIRCGWNKDEEYRRKEKLKQINLPKSWKY